MSEKRDDPPLDTGLYSRPSDARAITGTEIVAGVLSLAWLALVALIRILGGGGAGGNLGTVLTLVAVFLPVAMIWIAAITARTARSMREEARRLQAAIDSMRHAYVSQAQGGLGRVAQPRRVTRPEEAEAGAGDARATFASRRDGTQSVPSADRKSALAAPEATPPAEGDQAALALGTPADALREPVATADLIRALNFPDSAEDREGFRALRRALDDRGTSRLVRAAQDVLTLLSQDGIYMDDLAPDRARPEIWRRFAQGERGRGIAALGGVRDRSSLALSAARMRQDTVFRDAAHHFLRQFDQTFASLEGRISDAEIAALAETRTARAFMLLGRVTGTFD